jgi:hypothetical protein
MEILLEYEWDIIENLVGYNGFFLGHSFYYFG